MVRAKRQESASDIYHVVSRGCGRQILFEDDADRRKYLSFLKEGLDQNGAILFAWCLMGNHVHLLIKCPIGTLSNLMRVLNSSYSMYFNKRHDRVGHLMQGRFKSEPIETDEYFLTALRYIHRNPEKARMSLTIDHPWSSYAEYLRGNSSPSIADTALALELLDGPTGFASFHQEDDPTAPCIDAERGRMRLTDDDALIAANEVLGNCHVESITTLPKEERDDALCALKAANLSVRQIERLTGISRSVVSKACASR